MRRLDQYNNYNYNNNFQIDGSYNIEFSQCVDVRMIDEELFDEDNIAYTQSGQIRMSKSYVLFHVCQDDDCYYESEDDLYIVDLATYLLNVASQKATSRANYCEACVNYASFCGAYGGDDDANDGYNNRFLSNTIDCDQCATYGCYDGYSDNGAEDELAMIEDIADCLNLGMNWNGHDLYTGPICNQYGTGVEMAIFLDNECTVYTNQKSFSDIPSYYIYNNENLYTQAQTSIEYTFLEAASCAAEQEFDSPYNQNDDDAAQYDDGNANYYNYNNNNNNQGYEANEYCQNIFDGGATSFNNCGSQNYNNGYQDDDQNNYYQDDQYNFYSYDMLYQDSNDMSEVCSVVAKMEGAYTYTYDSGTTWDENASSESSGNDSISWSVLTGSNGPSGTMIALLYVLAVLAAIIVLLFLYGILAKHRRDRREQNVGIYQGGSLV